MRKCFRSVLVLAVLLGVTVSAESADEIKMGALFDLTGPTSDVGWHYADGARDYVRYVNEEKGGIGNGVKIVLNWVDYQYKIPQAIAAYAKFVKRDRVVAIIGFGTGDSEALKTKIVKDQVPYTSASFSQHLVWPAKWNFLPVVTYADQVRMVMKHIRSQWNKDRNPRMAIIYNDSGFGKAPLQPAELYAKEIGIDLMSKEVVGLQDLEATSQLLRIKELAVDFVFMQENFVATSTVLKDAQRLGLKDMLFTGNFWGTGKKLTQLAGEAAEGYLGIMPFAIWSDTGEGIEFAHMLNAKYHPDVEHREPQYIAGLVNAMIMVKGIEDALKAADGDASAVTGKAVFDALVALKDFDTKGLVTQVGYGPNERRGSKMGRLVTVRDGKLVTATDWIEAPPVPESELQGK